MSGCITGEIPRPGGKMVASSVVDWKIGEGPKTTHVTIWTSLTKAGKVIRCKSENHVPIVAV